MEFSNKLLVSLRQDIKTLNAIINEILEKVAHVELNSWLYPTKTCQESLKIDLKENSSKEKRYLDTLELIVDRLYLIINLVLDYTGKFPNVSKQEERRNILKPNNLSLSAATSLFWKTMINLNDAITINHQSSQRCSDSNEKDKKRICHKNTQTDQYGYTVCDSCSIAVSCIKEIVNLMENNIHANFISKIRKDLQEDIYNITQCGCMNRLTTAIIKDLNYFTKLLKDAEDKNKEDELKIENLNAKYCDTLKIIKNAECSLKKMRKHSANVKLKNKNLLRNINNLIEINKKNELKLIEERRKIVILETSIQENLTTVALLSTDNEKLHEDIEESLRENVNISSEKKLWKNRFSEIYLENRNLKSQIEEMETEMQSLKSVGLSCEKLADKLEQYNVEILQKTKNFENNFRNLTDTINLITKVQADSKLLKSQDRNTFQITGDPIEDMKRQVKVNKLDIERLEKNNMDLIKTIHRVQEQKFIKKLL